jgi:hypothetical protein
MVVTKKKLAELEKCYALAELRRGGERCFLAASEREAACLLFSPAGQVLETVWTSPGGVMSMEQLPGSDGDFLAVQRFYGPSDADDAQVVLAWPRNGTWQVRTLCRAPYAHRIGILRRGGASWLLVCCLKSRCEYEDDWRFPGACWAARLPEDPLALRDGPELTLTPVKTDMLQNHGFCKLRREGYDAGLVGCEEGTFLFSPPETPEGEWEIRQLCAVPSSDSVLLDLDGDGLEELGCISPFHGASLTVYHLDGFGKYVPRWKCPLPEGETEFLHATWACTLGGKPAWLVGWRKGTRGTAAVLWDADKGDYRMEELDRGAGAANLLHLGREGDRDLVLAANRETDEAALYILE